MRVTAPASVAVLTALVALPASGQRPGTIDVGGFAQFTRFDPSLTLNDALGVGGTLGIYVARGFAVEGSVAYASPNGVSEVPVRARLLYATPVSPSAAVLFGAGYVHNRVRSGSSAWEDGVTGLLGARFDLSPHVAARVGAVGDYFPSPLNEGLGANDNWNFSLQAGIDLLIGRRAARSAAPVAVTAAPAPVAAAPAPAKPAPPAAPPKDSDSDGVPDALDRCLGTPLGDKVDANGCSLPKDADGDGVVDTTDRCPDTPHGVTVDASGCPLDSDGDGVADVADKCPNTPRGEAVDAAGCPVSRDSDGDGVLDSGDRCPGTPPGQKVDALGCPVLFSGLARTLVLTGVNFESGSATLTGQSSATLESVAASLKAYPELRIEIAGYTDDRGTVAANRRLSQARADAVRAFLVRQGVAAAQLIARGYGAANPIDSNTTAAGRARNRRVELHRLS
jgi:OOP family OmpA-OmpF porin